MKNNPSIKLCLFFTLLFATAFKTAICSDTEKRYTITDYGAVGDGKTLNSKAIQATIDACAKKGGTVVIPKGEFLSGSIFLRPGVNLEIQEGGGIMTCGSEATIVRDVNIERCITRKPTVLRLKLRPDTPQQYENIHLKDITMEGGGVIFNIAPWSQYFDLKGQLPPKSVVRNITITNVKGTGSSSLGKITGNPDTEFGDIILKNVDVKLKTPTLEVGNIKTLKFENVVVNGAAMAVPPATVTPAKTK